MPKTPTPKTPGTHDDDDTSQQPRQSEASTPRERKAIAKEDHNDIREKISDKERDDKKRPGTSVH